MLHQCNIRYKWFIVLNPVIVRVYGHFSLALFSEKKSKSVTFGLELGCEKDTG